LEPFLTPLLMKTNERSTGENPSTFISARGQLILKKHHPYMQQFSHLMKGNLLTSYVFLFQFLQEVNPDAGKEIREEKNYN